MSVRARPRRSVGPGAGAEPIRPRVRSVVIASGIVLGSMALVWGVTAAAVVMLARTSRAPATRVLVIPKGTAARLGGGLQVGIPASMELVVGDVLVVRNEDTVLHQMGSTLIPAGATSRIAFPRASVASFACDFHPSRRFTLQVQPRGLDLRLTILPTVLLGPATGLALVGVWAIIRRLNTD